MAVLFVFIIVEVIIYLLIITLKLTVLPQAEAKGS
jgi:hypothetical protein